MTFKMLLVSIWEKIGHVVTALNCSTIIFTKTLPLLIIHDFGFPHIVDDSSYYPQVCVQWRPKQTSAGKLCIEYTSANNMKRWENIDMSVDGPGACFIMFMNYLYHFSYSIKIYFPPIPGHMITTNFCTCYISTAVMSCAKICGNHYTRICISTKWNFLQCMDENL